MTTGELILKLLELDPTGDKEVGFVCWRENQDTLLYDNTYVGIDTVELNSDGSIVLE